MPGMRLQREHEAAECIYHTEEGSADGPEQAAGRADAALQAQTAGREDATPQAQTADREDATRQAAGREGWLMRQRRLRLRVFRSSSPWKRPACTP